MSNRRRVELLAGAGDMEKLKTAVRFGADAVYFGGKQFGLRAFASNFGDLSEPIEYLHKKGKKAYITVNIYARNDDYSEVEKYLTELEEMGADGIIVSDLGIMRLAKKHPKLELHISTQANTTSLLSALEYVSVYGAKRVVLARELDYRDVKNITKGLNEIGAESEIFIHGAMCISYSGRCLLSNFLTGRDSNRGACVQACRWGYSLVENDETIKGDKRKGEMPIEEDENGTYILNSKDLCLIEHLDEIIDAGVSSLKIEGRMKSPFYIATVVGAYRRAIDEYIEKGEFDKKAYKKEVSRCSHRSYTSGFLFDDALIKQNYESSHQTATSDFLGIVTGKRIVGNKTYIELEMRNRFKVNDRVKLLSPNLPLFVEAKISEILDASTLDALNDVKLVQQKVLVKFEEEMVTDKLGELDIMSSLDKE